MARASLQTDHLRRRSSSRSSSRSTLRAMRPPSLASGGGPSLRRPSTACCSPLHAPSWPVASKTEKWLSTTSNSTLPESLAARIGRTRPCSSSSASNSARSTGTLNSAASTPRRPQSPAVALKRPLEPVRNTNGFPRLEGHPAVEASWQTLGTTVHEQPDATLRRHRPTQMERPARFPPGNGGARPMSATSTQRFSTSGGVGVSRSTPFDSSVAACATEAELLAFRNATYRAFGNLARAFFAMKTVASTYVSELGLGVGTQTRRSSLTVAEFEWCVTSYLKYSDRLHARQLFAALDREQKGEIGLPEMQMPSRQSDGLLSLADFRRMLLDRHTSLARAFQELEDAMEEDGAGCLGVRGRIMRIGDFVKATSFLGLHSYQAINLFGSIDSDGNGCLTFEEFMEALTNMPREILLQDFRRRLLAKYSSIADAFQHSKAASRTRLGPDDFVICLARLGISETEADLLFRIVDQDSSGDVSLDELREAVREAAPVTDLASFWKRFNAEWPEILVAVSAGGRDTLCQLHRAGVFVKELLISEEQRTCTPSGSHMQVADSALAVLTAKDFDALAARLDVSCKNACELWALILARAPRGPFGADEDGVCYVEDFLEQLHLWAGNPLALRTGIAERGLTRAVAVQQEVLQVSATARATLSALKAELKSEPVESQEETPVLTIDDKRRPVSRRASLAKQPKLPWSSHFGPSVATQILVW